MRWAILDGFTGFDDACLAGFGFFRGVIPASQAFIFRTLIGQA